MKKPIWKLVGMMLLMTMLLTACGGNAPSMNTNSDTAATTVKAETQAAETTMVAAETEITLNINIAQPRFREQYEKYINQFVEKYKAEKDVTIKYEMEMPAADQASEILKTRLAANENLDVFALHAINEIPQYYKAGYLEDLSNEPFVKDLYDSAKQAVTIDGKVVALPLESLTWGYLYNKKLFAELGLKPAMTLTEMKTNAAAIKSAGKTPFLASYNEFWIPQLFLPLIAGGYVTTDIPDFLTRMKDGTGSFKEFTGLFDIIDLVHTNANTDGLEIGGTDGCAKFGTGDYGMWVQGPWFSSTILESSPDFEIGVAPLPISDNAAQTKINNSVSTSLAVSSFSQQKDAAKALVSYFLDASASDAFFESVQFNPLSNVHTFKSYPWIDEANSYVKDGKAYVDLTMPQAVKDESGKMLQAYYSDAATQEDVIAALDEAWKIFNEVNK